MTADYIKRIEIGSLWSGRNPVVWDLRPDVNILSGSNGVGKTTIINKLLGRLQHPEAPAAGVQIDFCPSEARSVRFDVIRSFDRPLIEGKLLETLADGRVTSELDWQLYQLQRRYLDYQVNLANRMIEMLRSGQPKAGEQATEASAAKTQFLDIVDDLFRETGKKINRQSNEIRFSQMGEELSVYQLSSGEKQMLAILLTTLTQDGQPCVLLMDEPEISLHIEWQQQLIGLIRRLNPNVQIILSTHSPAVIMNGWMEAVTEVSDITQHH